MFSYNAVIKEIIEVEKGIRTFKIALKDGSDYNYNAGQFTTLGLPEDENNLNGKWVVRAYSITSAPTVDGNKTMDFYIVKVENGRLTTKLFNAKVGDEIYLGARALGHMNLENVEDDANVIFLGTGTGLAPLRGLIRGNKDVLFNGKRKVALFMGIREEREIGYRAETEALANEFADFSFFPCASRIEENKGNVLKGRINNVMVEALQKEWGTDNPFNPENTYVYLCGNPAFIDDTVNMLLEKGFKLHTPKENGNVFCDKH